MYTILDLRWSSRSWGATAQPHDRTTDASGDMRMHRSNGSLLYREPMPAGNRTLATSWVYEQADHGLRHIGREGACPARRPSEGSDYDMTQDLSGSPLALWNFKITSVVQRRKKIKNQAWTLPASPSRDLSETWKAH